MRQSKPTIPAIVGATASGKSSLARALADATGGRIISLDSRKIYRGLDIGTAKPTPELIAKYEYAMIDVIAPTELYSAFQYAETANQIISETLRAGRLPIIVGGTGLYLRALKGGVFRGPGANQTVRKEINDLAEREGWHAVYHELELVDPETAVKIGPGNKHRLMRALEVFYITGTPISSVQQKGEYNTPEWAFIVFGIERPRKELHERIARRTELMIERGLIAEVEGLLETGIPRSAPGFKSVGYREILELIGGQITQNEAVDQIKISTRQYAKRQLTWFRNQETVEWLKPHQRMVDLIRRRSAQA